MFSSLPHCQHQGCLFLRRSALGGHIPIRVRGTSCSLLGVYLQISPLRDSLEVWFSPCWATFLAHNEMLLQFPTSHSVYKLMGYLTWVRETSNLIRTRCANCWTATTNTFSGSVNNHVVVLGAPCVSVTARGRLDPSEPRGYPVMSLRVRFFLPHEQVFLCQTASKFPAFSYIHIPSYATLKWR